MTKSEIYWQKLRSLTPNGTQTLSKMPSRYVDGVYPKVLDHGIGGHVWDVDGRRFIDLISGLGCITVGYADHRVNLAAAEQMHLGVSFSFPTMIEAEVSAKLCSLVPNTDQWKFFKTGTEADMGVVKAARAFTGRDKVMVCGYHGWADWYSIVNDKKAGIPLEMEKFITKGRYNDIESFSALHTEEYACLIMEPMVFEDPKPGFLEALRELCTATGTILIFDEVVTGARHRDFVAQRGFGVLPDFTVLSKGIANGFPLAGVGGARAFMRVFERDDFFVSGTFGGEAVSLAACMATLDVLQQELPEMYRKGQAIKNYFNTIFTEIGAQAKGYPTRLTFDFPTKPLKALFMQEMCKEGVLIGYSNCIMADHTDSDVWQIFEAMRAAKNVIIQNLADPEKALNGALPVEALRLR